MSEYLPPEILFQIFLNLPSKTLRRFLSVSESWYALITSKPFVSSHLTQNPHKETNTFFILNLLHINTDLENLDTWDNDEKFSFFFYHEIQNDETQIKDLDVETQNNDLDQEPIDDLDEEPIDSSLGVLSEILYPPLATKFGINRVVGISNGLICMFKNFSQEFTPNPILWNPAIDVFVTLPSPGISGIRPDMYALGFWYDCKDNDFKVMRIVYRSNKEVLAEYDLPPLAEVYSLNTGEWRRINVDGVQCYMSYDGWSHAYVKGLSHWIGCRYDPPRCLIASFDIKDEVYREIMLPSVLASMSASNVIVTETMGCLAVIGQDLYEGFCRGWVMKEHGVFDSWTNLFDIPISTAMYYKFLGFWKNGDVLMMKNFNQLVLYSSESKSMVDLEIGRRYSTYVGKYEESLALLDSEFSDEWMGMIEELSV